MIDILDKHPRRSQLVMAIRITFGNSNAEDRGFCCKDNLVHLRAAQLELPRLPRSS
jgi:hypothetical protein